MNKQEFLTRFEGRNWVPFYAGDEGQPEIGRTMGAADAWEAITESRWFEGWPEEITEQAVINLISDSSCMGGDFCGVITAEEHKKRKAERERQELEQYVAGVARSAGVSGTDLPAVLDALVNLIDDADADLAGAREDGLCLGMGITSEQFYDHCDGIRSRGNEAARAIEWIAANCPLAYAQWEEGRKS